MRHTASWKLLAGLVVLLACVARPGSAQPSALPGAHAEARSLFYAGLAHSRAGRWAQAAAAFERSALILERPSTLQNLAIALDKEEQFVAALRIIERHEQISHETEDAPAREQLAELKQRLLSKVAIVEVSVAPDSARLRLDGRPVGSRSSPTRLRLDPGRHTLEADAEGFDRASVEVTLGPGEHAQRTITLRSTPLPPSPLPTAVHSSPSPTTADRTPRPATDASPPNLTAPLRGGSERDRRLRRGAWGTGALGLALGIVSAGLWTSTEIDANGWDADCTDCDDERSSLQRSLDRRDRTGNLLIGVAALSLATGVTLFVVSLRKRNRRAELSTRAMGLQGRLSF